jgi:hypothetical protein
VSIASRIPRYVDPQTTYTTARAAQTLAGLTPALSSTSVVRPPAPTVAIVEIARAGQEWREQAQREEDDEDHDDAVHTLILAPL